MSVRSCVPSLAVAGFFLAISLTLAQMLSCKACQRTLLMRQKRFDGMGSAAHGSIACCTRRICCRVPCLPPLPPCLRYMQRISYSLFVVFCASSGRWEQLARVMPHKRGKRRKLVQLSGCGFVIGEGARDLALVAVLSCDVHVHSSLIWQCVCARA